MGIALRDMPTKFEARKGMRNPKVRRPLERYLSVLGSIANRLLNRFKT